MFRAMTIAGSDSGGGAGIQADLKTFSSLRVYGTTVITALTAQNTVGVSSVHLVPPDMVSDQINAILNDIGTDSCKTGMLGNAVIIKVVAEQLKENQEIILEEIAAAEGKATDIGGYFMPNDDLVTKAMRPSKTMNAIIDGI